MQTADAHGVATPADWQPGLLPCNVVVYERGPHESTVAAMAPLPAMGLIGNPDVVAVAKEADARLRAALDELERGEAAASAGGA